MTNDHFVRTQSKLLAVSSYPEEKFLHGWECFSPKEKLLSNLYRKNKLINNNESSAEIEEE